MNAIELIEQQQKKLGRCMAYGVGEQLKEICRSEPASAALLENDLDKKGMGIADAEKKIRAFAGKNGGFATKQEADGILREFDPASLLIMSTHLISDIEHFVDYALFMKDGQVLLQGDADDLRASHGDSLDAIFRKEYR